MTPVQLYGKAACHRCQGYQALMLQRQVPFVFRDLKTDEQAAEEIREAFNGALPFPVLSIDGSWLRNPSHPQLLKRLARHGRYDHPLVHQPLSHRFVKYLPGGDAVVQYKKKGASLSDGLVLMHIELPQAQRGKGLGQQIAHGLFEQLIQQQIPATLHCSFLKKVARRDPKWQTYFQVPSV